MKLWILFALVCPNLSLEVAILNSTSCRSLEGEENVLEILKQDVLSALKTKSNVPKITAQEIFGNVEVEKILC